MTMLWIYMVSQWIWWFKFMLFNWIS